MNEYLFSQLNVGIKHSFEAEVDKDKMQKFLEISGDNNPMHIDHIFAKSNGMKDRIVYGLLTSSFYSTLVGMYLPGKYSILHSIKINFSKPVYINELLNVYGEIVFINKAYKQIEMKAYIKNDKEKISKAIIKIGLLHD